MPVEKCHACGAENKDANTFCGTCGSLIGPAYRAVVGSMEQLVKQELRTAIAAQFRDQKVVEIEITHAIADRLTGWAKIFAFFVGIPLLLLAVILGVFGVKTYTDVSRLAKEGQVEMSRNLESIQKQGIALQRESESMLSAFSTNVKKAQEQLAIGAEDAKVKSAQLQKQSDALFADYEKLRMRFADTKKLADELQALSKQVQKIEERVQFKELSGVTKDQQQRLERALLTYRAYLQKLGFRPAGDVSVLITEKPQYAMMSYYLPAEKTIVIDAKYAGDLKLLYREYSHRALLPDSHTDPIYAAVESGLAAYFPCSFTNDHRISAFSLENGNFIKYASASNANMEGLTSWAGAFWEIRKAIGPQLADTLLFSAWQNFSPKDASNRDLAAFPKVILDTERLARGPIHLEIIREIFLRKGIAL